MIIDTTRFGQVDIPDRDILRFPDGIPGFPEEKTFAFLPYEPDSPFAFLQSVAEPNLTFLVVEPFLFFKDYTFELDAQSVRKLGLSEENSPQVFNIVTVPEKTDEMTINLLAPIILNRRDRLAMQVVLEKTAYTTRHRLFPNGLNKKNPQGGE